MTPKEAFEILRDTPIDIRSAREDDIHSLYATAQNMALDALERQMWIPCSERLPEDIKTVLVTIEESKEPMLGWFGNKFGWRIVAAEFANIKDFTVLAWMPLPEPYKEGE